jgi:hypothetical protein
MKQKFALRLLFCCLSLISFSWPQIKFLELKQELLQARLERAGIKNVERKNALVAMFQEVGCTDHLVEQPAKGSKLPNVICTLPGETDSIIIVGAHFDQVDEGKGIVDNWSGASLLPSLYQSLKPVMRKHTFVFIGFTDEEKGLVGSRSYAKQLVKEDLPKIHAMVNLDTLGLSDSKVWVSHADKNLVEVIARVANTMLLPVTGMNVDNIGTTDSESFAERKIPSITVHSLTSETLGILHSKQDTIAALKMENYFASYRLLGAYLSALDSLLMPAVAVPAKAAATPAAAVPAQ